MSEKTVFVSLEVQLAPGTDPAEVAELVFDHACMIDDERIASIDGYDFNVVPNP